MTPREIRHLAAELAARLRADIEALPADHPARQELALQDAARARAEAEERAAFAVESAAKAAQAAADDARHADLKRRVAALERRVK